MKLYNGSKVEVEGLYKIEADSKRDDEPESESGQGPQGGDGKLIVDKLTYYVTRTACDDQEHINSPLDTMDN